MSAEDPSLHVYGTGRVGLAILALARERGVTIAGAWNPRELRRERSALAHGIPIVVSPDPPTVAADLWLIAVPDDAIAAVAERLAASPGPRPKAVAHCAGALPASLLRPLATEGVACGSFHPAMTFRGAAGDAEALAGAVVAIEGEARAVALLERLADRLGVRRVAVAPDQKPRKQDCHADHRPRNRQAKRTDDKLARELAREDESEIAKHGMSLRPGRIEQEPIGKSAKPPSPCPLPEGEG